MVELQTGDVLLFATRKGYLDSMINFFTKSKITHVGFVLKDPTWLNPCLKGTFLWESGWEGTSDPQDGIVKLGVQITSIEDVKKHFKHCDIYLRRPIVPSYFFFKGKEKKFKAIHEKVYDKPYDLVPYDWLGVAIGKKIASTTDRFWCSALVGYIMRELGILNSNTNFTSLSPSDFSIESNTLKFAPFCGFENNEIKL